MLAQTGGNLSASKMVCDSLCHAGKNGSVKAQASMPFQIKEFFTKVFNTSDWPARWHCGIWSNFHGWLYIISDLTIWAAYFAIPLLLFRIVKQRKDIPFPKVFWLFIAFIMLCGTSHLMDAIIFWWPAYRLSALIRLATGVVSVITVYALYKIIPLVQKLRTLDQLEAEIEERKKAEQEARHQLILKQATEELMAKKDEFMSIASHELKTPITSVKASLQILQRMAYKSEALQPVAPFVNKAARQVNKLTDIIHELLDVTRIQAGKLELHKTDFNLLELVKESVDQCEMDGKKHKIQIEGDKKLQVCADRNRLDQVVCNLLTNAIKYSPANFLIKVRFGKQENGTIKMSVADSGIGIPADKIENIFDRFYRVENTSQYYSGIGLGLFISSEIIKRHGGEIGVESEQGKGSTFWFAI
jgi:two-component system, chemotaxis family, sensor kinase Cph1